MFGDGGPQFRFVAAVKRQPFDEGRPGGDFAGGLKPTNELPDPFGAGGVFAAELGEAQSGLIILENSLAQVEGKRTHDKLHIRGCSKFVRRQLKAQEGI